MSGWYFEYVEFPNQRRTEIQENNNYKPRFVSVHLSELPSLPPLAILYQWNSTLNSSILIIVLALVNVAYLSWRNKVKKRPEERAKLLAKYCKAKDDADDGGGGLDAWMELGDRHPDFVYTL